jgi:hypothetical protein
LYSSVVIQLVKNLGFSSTQYSSSKKEGTYLLFNSLYLCYQKWNPCITLFLPAECKIWVRIFLWTYSTTRTVILFLNHFCIAWIFWAKIRFNKVRGYSKSTVMQLMYVNSFSQFEIVLYSLLLYSKSCLSLYSALEKIGSVFKSSSISVMMPYIRLQIVYKINVYRVRI